MDAQATTEELVEMTEEDLKAYDGKTKSEIRIAVKDPYGGEITVFNMTPGKDFYGPGGPYEVFAGRHASHGLAKSSTSPSDVTGDLDKLSQSELDTLQQWHTKFATKYPIVGKLVDKKSG
mmetsp:Transcript_6263/g.18904  ORF Transcript_6263/g.18904 Transcript_6263/m.18904 type:complete len:120 (+) Transcript_6263:152-511(+)